SLPGVIATDHAASPNASVRVRGRVSKDVLATMRVFVDGVELHDASALRSINPEFVERLEVRPGAAAGALRGASGGIITIVTRRDTSQANTFRPRVRALVSAGSEQSLYDEGSTLAQRHAATATGGSTAFQYLFGGGM